MASVRVRQNHALGQAKAVEALKQFEADLAKFRARLEWAGSRAKIKGTGVGGEVRVSDDEVAVDIELGMLARAVGVDPARLEGSVKKRLASALAG